VAARRRGRGEGSIYRRNDGRWVGQYEVGAKRRYVYGKTRKEVASKLTKLSLMGTRDSSLIAIISPSLSTSTAGWTP